MITLTLTAGQISRNVEVGPGARITTTGSGKVQYLAGTLSDARNNNGTWVDWPLGSTAGTIDAIRRMTIRGVATGALTVTIDEEKKDTSPDGAFWDSQIAQWNADNTGLIDPVSGLNIATLGTNVVTAGPGGMYATIQEAVDSITDNLPVTYTTGTVSVTNGVATVTFSANTGLNVIPGLDLFTIDGVRYYQFLKGPTTTSNTVYTLLEVYQGATNAAATFQIIRPNPRTVLMLPGVEQATTAVTIADLKPYVSLAGVDARSCIVRRWADNPGLVPVIKMKHGCVVDNITLDTTDGHFELYRMGLDATATSETQAMKGSRWEFGPGTRFLNGDPLGLDTGSDFWMTATGNRFNDDLLLFDGSYFQHCWDGFTTSHKGTGKLTIVFNNPYIEKIPLPQSRASNVSGCTFFRAESSASATVLEVVFNKPYYDQRKYSAGEVVGSGVAGVGIGFTYGLLLVSGAYSKGFVIDPTVLMDVGTNPTDFNAGLIAKSGGTIEYSGGYFKVDGAGSGTNMVAPVINSGGTVINVNPGRETTTAYAATVTPDANVATVLNIGTLTGNITIAAPLNPQKGQRLTINYAGNATPGWTITYNAVFKSSAVPASTASGRASHSFVYDGTNWMQSGGALVWL